MRASYETAMWLETKTIEARQRYERKTRSRWWRRVLWWTVPSYGDSEMRRWTVALDLWGDALREMKGEGQAAEIDRLIVRRPQLRIVASFRETTGKETP